MIKLKMSREELLFLTNITSPLTIEKTIVAQIKAQQFDMLDFYFTMLEVGLLASKKYLFDGKITYKIGLKPAQAASLITLFCTVDTSDTATEWMRFLIMKWTGDIHHQLTNYQPKYYGRH
jgi:hypothetical protein